ncbi:MAG: hypothetical protein KJ621_11405 [Proteobacteria bacterium]|nr:hypothetical protein [Pseudomonadota bacterium]MBU1742383.1 hypothetical protein [Pseudomonadota bacterium]
MTVRKVCLGLGLLLAAAVMVAADTQVAEARRFGGFRSFSSSRSSSFRSSYRSSSRYRSRSSSRRSYSSRRTSTGRTRGFRTSGSSRRATLGGQGWMKRGRTSSSGWQARRQASRAAYSRYRSRTGGSAIQRTGSRSYRSYQTRRQAINSRPSRMGSRYSRGRTVYVTPRYSRRGFWGGHGYPRWGYHSLGIWDLAFLMTVNHLFWYHHWNSLSRYRNQFDQQKWAELEARVAQMEAKGVKRDPKYLDPNTDPDLQFSRQFGGQHPDVVYAGKKKDRGASLFWVFVGISVAMAGGWTVWYVFIRRT